MVNENKDVDDDFDGLVMCEVRNKARELAEHMRDNCAGGYVAEEMQSSMSIAGQRVNLFVAAYWERSFWFDFKATIGDIEYAETVYT